jgi:PIN domain nuclease of toxin-antitoxin system
VKGFLLDTNVSLIATADSKPKFSARIRRAIETGPLHLSVLSYWEIAVKSMKGKLEVGDPRSWWNDALDQLACAPLAFEPQHVTELLNLPALHSDPFDRGLIAQAMAEELALVTMDGPMREYASNRLRVVW